MLKSESAVKATAAVSSPPWILRKQKKLTSVTSIGVTTQSKVKRTWACEVEESQLGLPWAENAGARMRLTLLRRSRMTTFSSTLRASMTRLDHWRSHAKALMYLIAPMSSF